MLHGYELLAGFAGTATTPLLPDKAFPAGAFLGPLGSRSRCFFGGILVTVTSLVVFLRTFFATFFPAAFFCFLAVICFVAALVAAFF